MVKLYLQPNVKTEQFWKLLFQTWAHASHICELSKWMATLAAQWLPLFQILPPPKHFLPVSSTLALCKSSCDPHGERTWCTDKSQSPVLKVAVENTSVVREKCCVTQTYSSRDMDSSTYMTYIHIHKSLKYSMGICKVKYKCLKILDMK